MALLSFRRLAKQGFALAILIATVAAQPLSAFAGKPNPRYAAIVMDADTGVVISESNADKNLHPASLVKMMTLLMVFEAVENGRLSLRDSVPISRHAASMSPSRLGLDPGSTIRVEDAIYAVVTKSANDIAVALGEKLGGTERNFAAQMNQKARAIGMTRTHFVNASGLHNPRQLSSARDMAKLGRYILTAYPRYYHYFSTRNFTYRGMAYRNHNRLMETYRGMDGFKTGFVQASGFNLVASARRGDRRLIGVVFGGRSANSRNAQMASLLDQGFAKQGSLPRVEVARSVPASSPAKVALASTNAPLPERKPVSASTPVKVRAPVPAVRPAAQFADAGKPGSGAVPDGNQFRWTSLTAYARNQSGSEEIIGEGDYDRVEERSSDNRRWGVQVGAFASRARTDMALAQARARLPASLADADPVIAPLKTREGWVFRGRLVGYTREEAQSACRTLPECLPISPQGY